MKAEVRKLERTSLRGGTMKPAYRPAGNLKI